MCVSMRPCIDLEDACGSLIAVVFDSSLLHLLFHGVATTFSIIDCSAKWIPSRHIFLTIRLNELRKSCWAVVVYGFPGKKEEVHLKYLARRHPYILTRDVSLSGRSLVRLNENSLLRLGIYNQDHRSSIWREISKLRLRSNILLLRDLERRHMNQ